MNLRNGKIRILIVEDDMPLAMMMVHVLAQNGIEADAATTGRRALQMAASGHFDLITLDVDLPDISGFEVCRLLKENTFFRTPIVFVSGRLCPQDVQRGLDAGAADYITKPFETFEFLPRLLSHIKQTETVA